MSWCGLPVVYLKRAHQENPMPLTMNHLDSVIAAGYQRPLNNEEMALVLGELSRLRERERIHHKIGEYSPAELDTLLGVRNCLDRFVEILEAQHTITATTNLHLGMSKPPLLNQVLSMKSHLSAMMEAIAARNSHTTTHDPEGPTP